MEPSDPPPSTNSGPRVAVILAIVGLICVLLFLWFGFQPWTVGVGIFLGLPLLALAVLIYITTVIRDLRKRGAL